MLTGHRGQLVPVVRTMRGGGGQVVDVLAQRQVFLAQLLDVRNCQLGRRQRREDRSFLFGDAGKEHLAHVVQQRTQLLTGRPTGTQGAEQCVGPGGRLPQQLGIVSVAGAGCGKVGFGIGHLDVLLHGGRTLLYEGAMSSLPAEPPSDIPRAPAGRVRAGAPVAVNPLGTGGQ